MDPLVQRVADDEPGWMTGHAEAQKVRRATAAEAARKERIAAAQARARAAQQRRAAREVGATLRMIYYVTCTLACLFFLCIQRLGPLSCITVWPLALLSGSAGRDPSVPWLYIGPFETRHCMMCSDLPWLGAQVAAAKAANGARAGGEESDAEFLIDDCGPDKAGRKRSAAEAAPRWAIWGPQSGPPVSHLRAACPILC